MNLLIVLIAKYLYLVVAKLKLAIRKLGVGLLDIIGSIGFAVIGGVFAYLVTPHLAARVYRP
ncbi:MAG: hypothetical protein JWN01_672 [Patescibacteria group bacterium]|nr:hypothetical protein [Patescibacteria group bacterium]